MTTRKGGDLLPTWQRAGKQRRRLGCPFKAPREPRNGAGSSSRPQHLGGAAAQVGQQHLEAPLGVEQLQRVETIWVHWGGVLPPS